MSEIGYPECLLFFLLFKTVRLYLSPVLLPFNRMDGHFEDPNSLIYRWLISAKTLRLQYKKKHAPSPSTGGVPILVSQVDKSIEERGRINLIYATLCE